MEQDREPGRTFAPEDLGWLDFETRSKISIEAGTYRYFTEGDSIICSFAVGTGAPYAIAVKSFDAPLRWEDMPPQFHNFHQRVMRGEAKWVAWNHSFDKAAWNYGTIGFPLLKADMMIDAMTQAMINGLPPSLKMAGKYCGATPKVESGKDHIKLFCYPDSTATPQTHPKEWHDFWSAYAIGDITTMRDVFAVTRQLPLQEWREAWCMERINETGIAIDLDMVKHATWLANEDKRRSSIALHKLTEGDIRTVDQVKAIIVWLLGRLPSRGREILTKVVEEVDEDGVITTPSKFSLTRPRVEKLIAYLETECPELVNELRVLQIRLYGGGKAPAKFQSIWAHHVNGILFGQYRFSGASQTGRASSIGINIQNLTRKFLPYEHEAIEAVLAKCSYEQLEQLGDDSPVAKKLALLVRPAFVPRKPENIFLWSDWSSIEARIVPTLCDHLEGARFRLQTFIQCDADPRLPDLYTRTASDISGLPIVRITKQLRQIGKVAELALGFLGGVNSLTSMGAAYGVHFKDGEAEVVVNRWRLANQWAGAYGNELWNAMLKAKSAPENYVEAGRVGFVFLRGLLGGSMLMRLPSGRFLTYRAMRFEMVDEKDDNGDVIGQREELTYGRGIGRAKLWKGVLLENATQGMAADLLRSTLVRIEQELPAPVVLHSHDEIMLEVKEADVKTIKKQLHEIMCRGFSWTEGLPIASDETISPYYSKWEKD